MTLESRSAGTPVSGRSNLLGMFQVKGQTNTAPGPPGWELGAGPTPPPCKRSIVTERLSLDTLMYS